MNKLAVSVHMHDKVKEMLSKQYELIELFDMPTLPEPVAAHPDMLLLKLSNKYVLTRSLYDSNARLREVLDESHVVFAENEHGKYYPNDVGLNALGVGSMLFANESSLDPNVKKICNSDSVSIVNIKQGYAKCSTLAINNSIITADSGMIKAAAENGLETLKISAGNIVLDGYDYGFIGGASYFDELTNTVYFFGNIESLPDFRDIKDFLYKRDVKIVCADMPRLYDYGGAVMVS